MTILIVLTLVVALICVLGPYLTTAAVAAGELRRANTHRPTQVPDEPGPSSTPPQRGRHTAGVRPIASIATHPGSAIMATRYRDGMRTRPHPRRPQVSDFDEREFERVAKATVEHTLQRVMDRLQRECTGMSVEETKRRVALAWEDATDAAITDPELTTYATQLAAGSRVIIRLE